MPSKSPGGILAFEIGGGGPKRGKDTDGDPRMDAAESLMSAIKSGNAKRFLKALDLVQDMRDMPDEMGDMDDLGEDEELL